MSLNRIFFITALIGAYSQIHSEYLVFERFENNFKLIDSSTKYAKVYAILMKYQWPMATASFDHMTQEEIAELTSQKTPAAEEEFIRKRLKALDPALDIVFIPTITYELFILDDYSKNGRDYSKIESPKYRQSYSWSDFFRKVYYGDGLFHGDEDPYPLSPVVALLRNILPATDECTTCNYKNSARELHYEINNSLLTHIKDSKLVTQDYCVQLSQKIASILGLGKDFSDNIGKFVAIEYKAHTENKGLLFRAAPSDSRVSFFIPGKSKPSTPLEPTLLVKDSSYEPVTPAQLNAELAQPLKDLAEKYKYIYWEEARSISYGNSLFAGLINDSGACVYHIANNNEILYALFIDKHLYAQKNGLHQLLYISPVNTLVALFSEGGLFHSRTIAYSRDEYLSENCLGLEIDPLEIKGRFFIRKGDVLKRAYELSDYIAKNAFIFNGSLEFPNQDIELLVGQKDLTNLLKLMLALRTNISRIKSDSKNCASSQRRIPALMA